MHSLVPGGRRVSSAHHTMSAEEGLLRAVKLHLAVVAAWSNRFLRPGARLDPTSLTQGVLPADSPFGRFDHLFLLDLVGAWADLAWVVDKAAHFADIAGAICILLVCIDDRG